MIKKHLTYWQTVWKQFCFKPLGLIALFIVSAFILMAIYAPLLASSKPLFMVYQHEVYFPLFRYLFYPGFFSKPLDVFYNLFIFTVPIGLIVLVLLRNQLRRYSISFLIFILLQSISFIYLLVFPPINPAFSPKLAVYKHTLFEQHLNDKENPLFFPSWQNEVDLMSPYARLNLVLNYQRSKQQHAHLMVHEGAYRTLMEKRGRSDIIFPTLWNLTYGRVKNQNRASFKNTYEMDKHQWLEEQLQEINFQVMPLVRPYHWEDDAAGDQALNQLVDWLDLTRINRKDMVSALIFGVRISLSVGLLAIGLALLIGIPIGALAGYYGGKIDLITYRLIEVWESMPTFFMLLMVVAFLQSKSIFLVIAVIGLFGWTGFSRFIRGEFLRQKQLPYAEACRALGYNDRRIIFSHLLPNAIAPLLTLVPFAIMGAITSEAGLSFLGLGEEGSNSWGILMDEGRTAFPSESYLLWPPAILLTILLVSIALVGDTLRDVLDPKLHRND